VNKEEILKKMLESGALLEGHFELRSGLHSDRYFQCAHVLRFPQLAEELCRALAQKLRDSLGDRIAEGVVAPALGGIIVGHELAKALGAYSIFTEKEGGKLALRRFRITAGDRYVVAEDVITRGGRVQETIDIVESGGGRVVAVAVLVDRSGGQARFSCPTFSLLGMDLVTYEPTACPLCAQHVPLTHPGS